MFGVFALFDPQIVTAGPIMSELCRLLRICL